MEQGDVFVIAVKRDRRSDVPADWMQQIRDTSGVTVMGDDSDTRVQVRASEDAIERVRSQFSDYLHIEKLIPHTF